MKVVLCLNRRVTVLALLLMPFLLVLGNWQLERAEEKRVIESEYRARRQQEAVAVDSLDPTSELAFVPVRAAGRFDNQRVFLLDNRVRNGQLGYEVVTPFVTQAGQWLLINRGWAKAPPRRETLPELPVVEGEVVTRGRVYVPPGEPFLLADQDFQDVEWPLVVQAVEVDKFSSLLGQELFPHLVRIQEGAPGALVTEWQAINVRPEKHTAYALQWFAMAIALAFWFLFANTNLWQVLRHKLKRDL